VVKFACTSCKATLDTDRDRVRVPSVDAGERIGRTTTEYKCAGCGAFYALRFRVFGIFAYVAAAPVFILVLASYTPELAAKSGAWLGRVAYQPIQTLPPNNSFKPKPPRGSA
jgi:predicted RNA-binding Zn-ribbon protein involved in translation (DUF1610 family)